MRRYGDKRSAREWQGCKVRLLRDVATRRREFPKGTVGVVENVYRGLTVRVGPGEAPGIIRTLSYNAVEDISMANKLTTEQQEKIADALEGTCNSGFDLAEEYGVELEDIEEAAGVCGVYRCTVCDWWTRDLADVPDEDAICIDCAEDVD